MLLFFRILYQQLFLATCDVVVCQLTNRGSSKESKQVLNWILQVASKCNWELSVHLDTLNHIL